MLFQIIEENGVKKIKALTADTGTGAPVGSFVYMYKKSSPSGYLYCDGSTFDETAYPALYLYLGSNVLPDYRECVMVGAEQNTTDTIATHDVYTQGEFKDDQLEEHYHHLSRSNSGTEPIFHQNNDEGSFHGALVTTTTGQNATPITTTFSIDGARSGTTTHGKQKAVYVYIKATSGLAENQQENVLNATKDYVDNSNSYSTDEILTGGKWIDGKPIYSKTIDCGALPNATGKAVAHNIANIGTIVKVSGTASRVGATLPLPYVVSLDAHGFNFCVNLYVTPTDVTITDYANMTEYTSTYVTLEYTKTTD